MSPFTVDDLFDFHTFTCNVCGIDVFDDSGFCADCTKELPFNSGKTCMLCGSMLLSDADYCHNCKPNKVFFDRAYSSFDYDGQIKKLIYGLKYGNRKYLAKVFAMYLANTYLSSGITVDCVTEAPLSNASYIKRGYNQSYLLAKEFCALTKLPHCANVVAKTKDTQQQEKLSNAQRRQNLLGAFVVTEPQAVKGKRILLIDDVKTTGTTLSRIAKVLKQSNATKVYGLTVASLKDKLTISKNNDSKEKNN